MQAPRRITITDRLSIGGGEPVAVIAGLCVIENRDHTLFIARELKKIAEKAQVPFVFKASYDKANRTSIKSYRGPGVDKGLEILGEVKRETGVPVLTDVHTTREAEKAAAIVDILQVPAFLSRQTDLVVAAAATRKPVNIKKGQFLAPWDATHIVEKARSTGNEKILLTERGTTFGYNNLVVDFRSLVVMRGFGVPVIYDATHSVQLPGGAGSSSGGQREFIPFLARAAVAVGVDALYFEVHDHPEKALSDGANSLILSDFADLLNQIKAIETSMKKESS